MVENALVPKEAFGHLLDLFQGVFFKTSQVPPDEGVVEYLKVLLGRHRAHLQCSCNGGLINNSAGMIREAPDKKSEIVGVESWEKALDIAVDIVCKIFIHPETMKKRIELSL